MISITEKAAERIRGLLEKHSRPESAGLRLRIHGGGCSGLSYELDLEDAPSDADTVCEEHGVRVFLDPKSAIYVEGSVLDLAESLMGVQFQVRNPQAKSVCSCGESFAI